MNPHTRLIAEKRTSVTIGAIPDLSAAHPTAALNDPIKPTYSIYRIVVVGALNVNLALAKKLKLTAKTNPAKLASAWLL